MVSSFTWDPKKEWFNILKHGVDFATAARAFKDPRRKVYADLRHSGTELRFFCIGKVEEEVLTVRFAMRGQKVRIIGAGRWRKGRRLYEKERN